MREFKDEELKKFLKQGLAGVPSAPLDEFSKIQNSIKKNESSFRVSSIINFFNFNVQTALFSIVFLTILTLGYLKINNKSHMIVMSKNEYIALFSLSMEDENIEIGKEWL